MKNLHEIFNDKVIIVEYSNYRMGVVDVNDNAVVPSGKYDWTDGSDGGQSKIKKNARAFDPDKSEDKRELIDAFHTDVLPLEYYEIWIVYGQNCNVTRIVPANIKFDFDFSVKLIQIYHSRSEDDDYYEEPYDDYDYRHYGEYGDSYAQDEMGYSDDDIDDVFEGDPDAYWNID